MLQAAVGNRASFFPATAVENESKLREGARVLIIAVGDADDQKTNTNAGAPAQIAQYQQFFSSRPFAVSMGGILCAAGGTCGEHQNDPHVSKGLIDAFGGFRGDINVLSSIAPAIEAILDAAIADVSPYRLAEDAITSSIKVAIAAGSTRGACNTADVPRSRNSGFDYDPRTRTVQFFGDCRPNVTGSTIAFSYRTWREAPAAIDSACLCECAGNNVCTDTGETLCACSCNQDLTCDAGFVFDAASCSCACDAGAASCPATHVLDPDTCACSCDGACNNSCGPSEICQPSTCECRGIGG